ncbi:uncharacterized protein LOC131065569 [Cryptomeria japonica]|uniref:uncharacterized protein LOC131065569 n=1 Tax=Cryptomeria japonica TaxID=3369 RepID=UPI0025AC08CD|nr:uncharacterized protein LOC131065569 [Cryptomeria japonica]XP_057856105.1 uncharacterized protein LOC131065569 [Cryptomeria japonica]
MVMAEEKKKCSLCEKEKWCLHHLKNGGKYCHLCSSCVLITHCDMYCPYCLEDCGPNADALLKCSTCLRSVHVDCHRNSTVSNPNADPFRCLHCLNPNSDLIPFAVLSSNCPTKKKLKGSNGRAVSPQEFVNAKLVLTAARITSVVMHRVAREATAEAQLRAKQAAQLRREATEALHRALAIANENEDKLRRGVAKANGAVANPGNMNSEVIARNMAAVSLNSAPLQKSKVAGELNGQAR